MHRPRQHRECRARETKIRNTKYPHRDTSCHTTGTADTPPGESDLRAAGTHKTRVPRQTYSMPESDPLITRRQQAARNVRELNTVELPCTVCDAHRPCVGISSAGIEICHCEHGGSACAWAPPPTAQALCLWAPCQPSSVSCLASSVSSIPAQKRRAPPRPPSALPS